MSQASIPSPSPQAVKNSPSASSSAPAKPILTLSDMVAQAAKDLKRVELAKTILGLSIIVCLLGLALILVDHWVWQLPKSFRWSFLVLTCGISIFWVLRQLIPLLGRSINPIFAARQIETKVPELKDSLVSYMQLNDADNHTPKGVVTAIGRFAVDRLSRHDVSEFVSSSTPLRLAIWLFAILILSSIYFIVSPKSGLDSLLRLAMPWHSINAPTRVKIVKVSPQDVTIGRGQIVEVEVEVQGILQKDSIQIEFSSLDGQFLDRKIEMHEEVNGMIYRGSLTMGERGIVQDLEYRVRAGDVVAGPFHVTLEQMPVLEIEKMQFEYPRYTRLAPSQADSVSGFSGLEGTKVHIFAKSNQEMKSGQIEVAERAVGGEPSENQRSFSMTAQKESLNGIFQLQLNKKADNPSAFTYRIAAVSRLGQSTQEPVAHEYQVTKDESPVINWGVDYPETLELPVNQLTDFVITASDPDFGLSQIKTVLVRGRSKLDEKTLLQNPEGIQQPVTRTWRFEPTKMGLRPGDELTLEAHAFDNRRDIHDSRWEPNSATSRVLKIKIVAEQKKPTEFSAPEQQMKPLSEQPVDGSDVQKPDEQKSQKTDDTSSDQNTEPDQDKKLDATDSNQTGDDSKSQGEETKQSETDKTGAEGQESGSGGKADKSASDDQGDKQSDAGKSEKASDNSGDKAPANSGKESTEKQNAQSDQSKEGHEAQSSKDPSGSSASEKKSDQSNKDEKGAQDQGGGQSGQSDSSEGGGQGQNDQKQSGGGQSSGGQPSGGQPSGEQSANSNQTSSGGGQQGKSNNGSSNSSNKGSKDKSDKGQESGASNPEHSGESGDSDDGQNNSQDGSSGKESTGKQSSSKSGGTGKPSKSSGSDPSSNSNDDQSSANESDASDSSGGKPTGGQSSSQKQSSPPTPGKGEKGRLENVERGSKNPDAPKHDGEAFEEINQWIKEHGDPKANPDAQNQSSEQDDQSSDNDASNPSKNSDAQSKTQSDQNPRDKSNGANEGDQQQDSKGNQSSQNKDSKNNPNSASDSQKQGGSPTKDSQQKQPQSSSGAGKSGQSGQQSQTDPNAQANSQGNNGNASSQSGDKGTPSPGSTSSPGKSTNGTQPGNGDSTDAPSGVGDGSPGTSGSPSKGSSGHTTAAPTKANVDYAKKVTDLALDYLDRQKDQPDPELLKRLGWTDEQLKAFLERWKKARENGVTPVGTKQDYANDLRSLGIKPPTQGKRSSTGIDDKLKGLSEEGGRSKPPSTLQSQYEAFRKAAQQKPSKK